MDALRSRQSDAIKTEPPVELITFEKLQEVMALRNELQQENAALTQALEAHVNALELQPSASACNFPKPEPLMQLSLP